LDRSSMDLPQNQIELLDEIYKVNSNIVVVLSCGSAIEMPWIGKVKGLVHGYLNGQAGARAVRKVLSGEVNPSGKLAETYPLHYEDTPSYHNFPGKESTVEYRESLYVGYRYYDSARIPVRFPFGFGLSYTSFEYSDLKLDSKGLSFSLKNTGSREGQEVVQLYVSASSNDIFRPKKELKGFKKVRLQAGESTTVRIDFDDKTFRYFNVKTQSWEIEGGEYRILLGASSTDIRLEASLKIEGTSTVLPYEKDLLPSYYSSWVQNTGLAEFEALLGHKAPKASWDRKKALSYNDMVSQCQYAKGLFARFVYQLIRFAHWFLKKIGQRSTANLITMSFLPMPFRGLARMTGGLVNMPMVDGVLMIVNGHFFRGLGHVIKEQRNLKKQKKLN